VNSKDSDAKVRYVMIYTPLVFHPFKTPAGDSLVECFVPDSTGLFYAIDIFMKLHNPVFFAWFLKSRRLFHIGNFLGWQNTMKKGSFNIKLLNILIERGCKMQDNAERFQSCSWSCYFIIVHTIQYICM
jgi:hypothetical protein